MFGLMNSLRILLNINHVECVDGKRFRIVPSINLQGSVEAPTNSPTVLHMHTHSMVPVKNITLYVNGDPDVSSNALVGIPGAAPIFESFLDQQVKEGKENEKQHLVLTGQILERFPGYVNYFGGDDSDEEQTISGILRHPGFDTAACSSSKSTSGGKSTCSNGSQAISVHNHEDRSAEELRKLFDSLRKEKEKERNSNKRKRKHSVDSEDEDDDEDEDEDDHKKSKKSKTEEA